MNDEELRKEISNIKSDLSTIRRHTNDKGHFCIIILLWYILFYVLGIDSKLVHMQTSPATIVKVGQPVTK